MMFFKEPMKLRKMSAAALRRKLVGAIAMLLVSCLMMVSSSYAWFVLSTAPEVSGIDTQVGANGALEVALLDNESWEDLTLLEMGDIDESVATTTSNLTWGNLVSLSDSQYGLSKIVLQPSRLYIEANGNDGDGNAQYKVNSTMLKIPEYGEDGRIQRLDKTSAVAYTYDGTSFSTEGYGVRAVGTSANMNPFQLGMNTARSSLVTSTSAARTSASNALQTNGNALAGIAIEYALSAKTEGYTDGNVSTVKALATGLKTALDDIESAIRQAFAGYITTDGSGVTSDNYQTALAAITATDKDGAYTKSLSELMSTYSGISSVIPNMSTYISKLTSDQTTVSTAITNCDSLSGGNYTWTQISGILTPLVDTDEMTLGGKSLTEVKDSVKNADGSTNYTAALALVNGGIKIGVPSGSGILSDIADFAGDYTAAVTIENFSYGGNSIGDVNATIATTTSENPVYLTLCSNNLKSATVTTASGSNAMTDFYGYCLDLAFRTNAADSNLLLQTESENRVYEGDTQNASLQGGGSYMEFSPAEISATKMIRLMQGIRVVFMDEDQTILGIATLDCTLGKDVYTLMPGAAEGSDGAEDYAYLDNGTGYQISDVITKDAYDALPEKSSVIVDKTAHTLKAKLYLHKFSMTVSTEHTEEEITANGGVFYTGGITIGEQTSSSITSLEQDIVKKVSVLVYLDGTTVTNASVAANSAQSMAGTLNLQFSSSAELVPAENTDLRKGSDGAETTGSDSAE